MAVLVSLILDHVRYNILVTRGCHGRRGCSYNNGEKTEKKEGTGTRNNLQRYTSGISI
jgi:hypothetical protein